MNSSINRPINQASKPTRLCQSTHSFNQSINRSGRQSVKLVDWWGTTEKEVLPNEIPPPVATSCFCWACAWAANVRAVALHTRGVNPKAYKKKEKNEKVNASPFKRGHVHFFLEKLKFDRLQTPLTFVASIFHKYLFNYTERRIYSDKSPRMCGKAKGVQKQETRQAKKLTTSNTLRTLNFRSRPSGLALPPCDTPPVTSLHWTGPSKSTMQLQSAT